MPFPLQLIPRKFTRLSIVFLKATLLLTTPLALSAVQRLDLPLPINIEEQGIIYSSFQISPLANDLESNQPSLSSPEQAALQNSNAALNAILQEDYEAYKNLYDDNASAEESASMFKLANRMFTSKGYDYESFKYLVSLNGKFILYAKFPDTRLNLVALATHVNNNNFRQNIGVSFAPDAQAISHALYNKAHNVQALDVSKALSFSVTVSSESQASNDPLIFRTGEMYLGRNCISHTAEFRNKYGIRPINLFEEYYSIMGSIGEEDFDESDFTKESLTMILPQEAQFSAPAQDQAIEVISPLGGRYFLLITIYNEDLMTQVAIVSKAEDGSMKIHNHNNRDHIVRLIQLQEFKAGLISYRNEQCPPLDNPTLNN